MKFRNSKMEMSAIKERFFDELLILDFLNDLPKMDLKIFEEVSSLLSKQFYYKLRKFV